jgi:uncharacterized membrane protein
MKMVLKIIVGLPAVLFVVMGLRWLVAPADIAPEFGFVLGDGLGRSSQVGDFAAFFLTLGVCILMALVSGRRLWYYPPAMLLLLAAIGRILAWTLHDATFAGDMIVFEIAVAALLLAASRWLPERE